jgi:hypothetical protein
MPNHNSIHEKRHVHKMLAEKCLEKRCDKTDHTRNTHNFLGETLWEYEFTESKELKLSLSTP